MVSFLYSDTPTKSVIDGLELTGTLEIVKIATDGACGGKVVWKQTPLTTGAQTVEDSVQNFAKVGGLGGSAAGQNKERLKE
jgi:hypothetical protein